MCVAIGKFAYFPCLTTGFGASCRRSIKGGLVMEVWGDPSRGDSRCGGCFEGRAFPSLDRVQTPADTFVLQFQQVSDLKP